MQQKNKVTPEDKKKLDELMNRTPVPTFEEIKPELDKLLEDIRNRTQQNPTDQDGPTEPDPSDLAHDHNAITYGADDPTEYDPILIFQPPTMQKFLMALAFALMAAYASAQSAQPAAPPPNPKPGTCTFYDNTMRYCGAKSWKCENRCRKHHPREMQRRAAAYSKLQARRKNH